MLLCRSDLLPSLLLPELEHAARTVGRGPTAAVTVARGGVCGHARCTLHDAVPRRFQDLQPVHHAAAQHPPGRAARAVGGGAVCD